MTASSIDYVGAGTPEQHPTLTTVTVGYPAGWAANDYGLLAVYLDAKSAITTPTGWTAIASKDFSSSTNRRLALFGRKFAGGDTPSIAVTWASSTSSYAQISAYRGVNTSTPLDTAGGATTTGTILGGVAATITWPSASFAGSRQVLFLGAHVGGGFPTVSAPNLTIDEGDVHSGQAELSYDNTAGNLSFSSWNIARPSITTRDFQTTVGLAWSGATTPTQDLGYIAVTLVAADGTLPPRVEGQPQAAYSTGYFRPLLQQPAPTAAGRLMAGTVDGLPRLVVQVCDTTDTALYRWVDVTDRLRNLAPSRGAEQPADRPRVGTASVTLANQDGLISPWATSGAYTTGGISFMRAGTLLRFGVILATHSTLDDGWYPWFTGRIEDVDEGTADFADAWVTYSVTELTAEAAADNREAIGAAGANETFDLRLFRVMNNEWFYGVDLTRYSDTAIGDAIQLQATTLAGNSLNELYLDADSTYRRVLCGTDGALWATRMYPAAGTAAAYTFTNDTGTYGGLPLVSVTPYASRDRILNRVRASLAGGSSYAAGDIVSVRKYGPRAQGYGFPRTDLVMVNSADLHKVVDAWATRHAYDELGIGSIEVNADQDPALWGALTDIFSQGLEQHYVIEAKWKHPSGNLFDFTAVLNGFSYSYTPMGPGVQGSLVGTLSLEAFVAATA